MDDQTKMNHLYASQNWFETAYESTVLSSMKNLFPTLFGKGGADGTDTSKLLPSLLDADKWNSSGVMGLQFQVKWELPNVDEEFQNVINLTFKDHPEARDLALELLYRSKKFALELWNFIKKDFEFLKHKGYSKKESWELTCLSVCRIFEDIPVVQIIGRNSRDLKSPVNTMTAVIWATLKAHRVMAEYARCKFVEHPSISAVIVWHLADHHTRQDSTVEEKCWKLENKIMAIVHKQDSLESRIIKLEAKNGSTPPKKGGGSPGKTPKDTGPGGN